MAKKDLSEADICDRPRARTGVRGVILWSALSALVIAGCSDSNEGGGVPANEGAELESLTPCVDLDGLPTLEVANRFDSGESCGADRGLERLETLFPGIGDEACTDGSFLYWNDQGFGNSAGDWVASTAGLPPESQLADCRDDPNEVSRSAFEIGCRYFADIINRTNEEIDPDSAFVPLLEGMASAFAQARLDGDVTPDESSAAALVATANFTDYRLSGDLFPNMRGSRREGVDAYTIVRLRCEASYDLTSLREAVRVEGVGG